MSVSRKDMLGLSYPKFQAALTETELSYKKLSGLRKLLISAYETEPKNTLRRKITFVERQMKSNLERGVSFKRRIPNTGKRVVTTHTYKDSGINRKHNRVGQTYERVQYEDAEYDTVERKRFRKYKRKKVSSNEGEEGAVSKPKRRNLWIEAMKLAKAKLDAPALSIVYKEVRDPSDEKQVIGHKVYLEARKQMDILKAEMKTAAETAQVASS